MLPTQERLDTRDISCLEIYLRLVMEQEFLALKCISQLAFQRLALDGPETHVRLKELVIIASGLLGMIHSRIGILDHCLPIFAVIGVGAYTNAHGNVKPVLADVVHIFKLSDDLFRTKCPIFCVCNFWK